MSTAGMFAGEVTPQAPADEALTTKYKGYWWMEYGKVVQGICGTAALLNQGELLSVNSIAQNTTESVVVSIDPAEVGASYSDTKIVSFTFAFTRSAAPDPTFFATVIDMYNASRPAVDVFSINMDSNGYILLEGANSSGTKILGAEITNSGASFADGEMYVCSAVINLSDPTLREFYINAVNVAEDPAYTTWTHYVDDELAIGDTGTLPNKVVYKYGGSVAVGANWADVNASYNSDYAADTLGHVSFDDGCTLIAGSVWDEDGDVRDPQAWEGWYLIQPMMFFGPSFAINTGRAALSSYDSSTLETNFNDDNPIDSSFFPVANTTLSLGIGSKTEAA